MSKIVLAAWICVAVCVLAAVVAVVAHPLHWERTLAAALVLGLIAAGVAVLRTRSASRA